MRKIMLLALLALLTLTVAGAWATSQTTAPTRVTVAPAQMIDPIEIMKNSQDLPVHWIVDAI